MGSANNSNSQEDNHPNRNIRYPNTDLSDQPIHLYDRYQQQVAMQQRILLEIIDIDQCSDKMDLRLKQLKRETEHLHQGIDNLDTQIEECDQLLNEMDKDMEETDEVIKNIHSLIDDIKKKT